MNEKKNYQTLIVTSRRLLLLFCYFNVLFFELFDACLLSDVFFVRYAQQQKKRLTVSFRLEISANEDRQNGKW